MTQPVTGASRTAQDLEERTHQVARVIGATPEQVYAAFVTPERLARWWGPKGFRNTFEACEPRPGGAWRFVMHGPNGADHPNESVFETLIPSERIVIRHACGPFYTLTVTLEPEGAATRLTWRQTFDSAKQFASARRIIVTANEENLDRLEAELKGESPP